MASLIHVALAAVADMDATTREKFIEQFREYWCIECGGPAGCQCWNDE